ncbi:MAG: hypothetical protein K2W96_09735 [Gemmataceae bacterium]|nr:hypothetical protein [Gemmataceae bacterium]
MRRCVLLLALAAGCSTPERGRTRGDEGSFERAGNPQAVSPHARPSDTGAYVGYQVGGGSWSRKRGEEPTPEEGTWGWDYAGWCLPSRVILGWWHGKPQGGTGAYKTDGPRPLETIERRHEGHE